MAFPTVHWVLIDDDYYMPLVEVTEKSLPFLQNMKQAAVSLVGITQGQFDKCIADMPENIEFRDKRLADSYYGECTFTNGDTKMKLKGAAFGSFRKALVTRGLAFAMTVALHAAHCTTRSGIPGWSISELTGLKTNLVKAFKDAMQTFPGSGFHNYEVVKNEEEEQEEAEAPEEEDDRVAEVAEDHDEEEEEAEAPEEEDDRDAEVARLQRQLNEAKAEIKAQREEAQKQMEVAEKREAMKKLVKQAQAQMQAGKVQAAKRQTPPPGAIATIPKRPKASMATPTMPNMTMDMSAMAMMGMGAMAMMGMGAMANSGQTMFGPSSSSPPPASSFPSSSSSRPPMLRPRLELRLAQQARDAGDEGWEHL